MDQTQIDALLAQPVPSFPYSIDGNHVTATSEDGEIITGGVGQSGDGSEKSLHASKNTSISKLHGSNSKAAI